MPPKPIIIAAPSSGSGKTTVALGVMAALKARGLRVAPFKVGPDFIDPGHHAAVCGRSSRNLDGWMCGREWVAGSYARGCRDADLAVIEGVMGLFDGASGEDDAGSTAEIARWLDGRIVLVVDARSQARSVAALVKGFVEFDPRLHFAGVIFNRVGTPRHEELLRRAMASVPGLPPVLGCLPREENLSLPERHLGLVMAAEAGLDEAFAERLGAAVEAHLDLDGLLETGGQVSTPDRFVGSGAPTPPAARIAVARDEAFCFCYPENLELLQGAGAELVFFSPLRDQALPPEIDGLYLPGGYPELHAGELSENVSLLREIREAGAAGLPIYAECGGFMLLAESIDGRAMVGLFPGAARMLPRRKALGYRQVELTADSLLGPAGTVARGHEFHYSELTLPEDVSRIYRLSRRGGEDLGREGYCRGNVLGSYVHLHFGSNPQLAENFVRFCNQGKIHHRGTETQR
jgi:cobyrinic acid a,c-diamide synthase